MMNPSRLSLEPNLESILESSLKPNLEPSLELNSAKASLLPFSCASGGEQMACDRELLKRQDGGFYLRFYDWSPPALSVGYHQKLTLSHWTDLCKNLGFDLVRRPSGGRAVLHYQTLTYALVCPPNLLASLLKDSPRCDRIQTYHYLSGFLIQGMANLGIDLQWGQTVNYAQQANCFAKAGPGDLVTRAGEKLIGSAQVYAHGHILQHGAIVLHKDPELLQQFFGEDGSKVGAIASFPQFQGQSLGEIQKKVIEQLTKSASDYFGVSFD